MTHWLVRAEPIEDTLPRLRRRLESGEVREERPFGPTLDESLRRARVEPEGTAVWEEEDYCDPPLAQERRAVLDDHFRQIEVEEVAEGEGWRRIEDLPPLWDEVSPPGSEEEP